MRRRKKTRQISVGPVAVGGGALISVQSMTNTDTRNQRATVAQIKRLEKAGCDIVRVAVPDQDAAAALRSIVRHSGIPVIADIHFSHSLALAAIQAGVHGVRINPGNIGRKSRVAAVVQSARAAAIPIRIGINSGSLERDILKKYGHPTAEALTESALRNIDLVERMGYRLLKVSIKSADVRTTIAAYRLLSKKTRYPLHLGVTEAGTAFAGAIRSAVGIGVLLQEGIGDTIRVSLSADPVQEVRAGFEILKCLGLRQHGPELISCPTCGRSQIDVISLAGAVEKHLAGVSLPIKVAVMGCEVNGPGEAREADVGIAGGKKAGVIFKRGEIVRKCPKEALLEEFLKEIGM